MSLYQSARAVANARGDETEWIDWRATAEAAKQARDKGILTLDASERRAYANDVRDARSQLQTVGGLEFDIPQTIEVQNRHHWIDANINTFERMLDPVDIATLIDDNDALNGPSGYATRMVNTGSMAAALAFLSGNVLGQYDPQLLSNTANHDTHSVETSASQTTDENAHELYFVHPNIVAVAAELDVEYPRFRRWIAFHEVAHAAEFGAAPWLQTHLEDRIESGLEALTGGRLDRSAFSDVDVVMTAVEGYAELLMDRAFDEAYADLRAKLDARRGGGGPIARLFRRLLGLGMKERQYERGAQFFETIADRRGVKAAATVWDDPRHLPDESELDNPQQWIRRVNP